MDVEARILRAAVEVLSSAGFAGMTISAVARVAGVSRPTVYAHYGDRESLVSAVLGSVTTEVASRVVSEARSAPTAAEFVVEVLVALRRDFRQQPALAPLAFPQYGSTIFDGGAMGADGIAIARSFLAPLLDFHPELRDDLDEIAETMVRFLFSLVMFESERSASDDRLRGYLHRRLVPALGLPINAVAAGARDAPEAPGTKEHS
ncbi:TetR/AcrR family transcriptional regulator [Pseudonocardia sp. Cha107L01]|jgi:AcrR family transcriptional regulator|uniref:TetR/AcrR family transcriptional regulator n=1 Tax=Pseudonocardia sp. Cha107L01 TaxID=3457576 RepID=UPI00403E3E3A